MHEFQIDIVNFYLKKLNDKWLLFYACKSVQNYQILGSQLIVLTRDARTKKFVLEPYTRTFLTGYDDQRWANSGLGYDDILLEIQRPSGHDGYGSSYELPWYRSWYLLPLRKTR